MHCRHYYPDLEDINAYENTDNRLNKYGDEELNRAHIENMVQRYRRLSEGSLDPDNIAKYQAKLSEWENRLDEFGNNEVNAKNEQISVENPENSGIINTSKNNVHINKSSAASPLYISKKDELYNNAKRIKPIDGYEDIVIHADKHSFYSYNMQGDEFLFTAEEMAEILKRSKGYHGGNIRLIACESAAEGATAAQELSNILGVEILAPSDIVWVDPNGNMTISSNGETNTGFWVKVKPKKERMV